MSLSLCITTFERLEWTIESFAKVLEDPRIDDVVILDDASEDGSYEALRDTFVGNKKIRVIRQAANRKMSTNKRDAIALAKNEWAIIFDSDNILDSTYIDALFSVSDAFENEDEIFLPDYAKPQFKYTDFDGESIYAGNVRLFTDKPMFGALINTSNYVVNRDYFLKTWVFNPEIKATDTAWHAYNHLKSGGSFYVVPDMAYIHRVHEKSGFMEDIHYNMRKAQEITELIKAL